MTATDSENRDFDGHVRVGTGSFQPVFVVGCPRSGTTLLAAILDRHRSISISPETRFFESVKRLDRKRSPASHDGIADFILSRDRVSDLDVTRVELLARFKRYPASIASGYRALLEVYAVRSGKEMAGEKSPVHLLHVPTIFEWYPLATVLCLVRDGRDVVQSLLRVPWTHDNASRHAAEWRYRSNLTAQFQGRFRDRFHVVRFEDLLRQPEAELKRVFDLLGVYYDERVFDSGNHSNVVPKWERKWKAMALGPIDDSRVSVWQSTMSPELLHRMYAIMHSQLAFWGYNQLETVPSLSWFSRVLVWFQCLPFRRISYIALRQVSLLFRVIRAGFLGQGRHRSPP